MKKTPTLQSLIPVGALVLILMSPTAHAADVVKTNNLDTLNLGTSWVGGAAPSSGDVAVFDSTYATTGLLDSGGLVQWSGIRVSNPGGNVSVNNATVGNNVGLGTSGIDMSNAGADLIIRRYQMDASQTWNIDSGRTFRIGSPSATFAPAANNAANNRVGVFVNNSSEATITKNGAGTVYLDMGNVTLGNVNWQINAGTVAAIWNREAAFGTGTITLAGGGLADGTPIAGSLGNWTWNNPTVLQSATTSFIDNQNTSGSGRWLKIENLISGSGNLEFRDTGVGFNNADLGFVLAGSNTMSGTVTITSSAEVRVGGSSLGSANANAGDFGTLGNATVVNNGSLGFTRTDSHTVTNAISGTGSVRIGGGLAGTENQNVTFTGAKTYSGNTTIIRGTLTLDASASLPNTANIFLAPPGGFSVTLDVSASGLTLGSGQKLVGALTGISRTVNGNITAASGSMIVPGGSNTVNTLTLNNDLNLSGGGAILMDVNNGGWDSISVLGNLNPSGVTTIQVVNSGGLLNGTYPLINVSGTLGGNSNNFAITGLVSSGTRQAFSIQYGVASVDLVIGGSPAADLTWIGDGVANAWDTVVTTNWDNLGSPDFFYNLDNVNFTDTGSTTPAVNLTGTLLPGNVIVNSANNYTFGGTGKIGGTGTLTKSGTGTLTLNASNDFTGVTLVNGGTVILPAERALGTAPGVFAADQLTLDGGAIEVTGSLTLSDTNRGLTMGPGGGTLSVPVTETLTISNIIAGPSGTLTKTGAGTLLLTGNNSFNSPNIFGATIIDGGQVICANSDALGDRVAGGTWSPGFHLMEGSLDINGQGKYLNLGLYVTNVFLFTDSTITFGGKAGATTELKDSDPNHQGFGCGYLQTAPDIAIRYDGANNPGKATISARWAVVGTGAGAASFTNYLIQVDDSTATTEELEFTGQMSHLGYDSKNATITKTGAGTMKISAPNYFAGVMVSEGLLLVNHPQALGYDRAFSYEGLGNGIEGTLTVEGATVDLNGFSPAIARLSHSNQFSLTPVTTGVILNNGGAPSVLTMGYSVSNTVFTPSVYAGTIANGSGGVSVIKVGTGTQTLGGANTYTGGTTVSNGTLLVNGSITGGATVRAGGTLGGTGTVPGLVTVDAGGTLAAGASIGTLTLGTSPSLGGTVRAEVDRNDGVTFLADQVVVTGNPITYGGTLAITNTGAPLQLGDTFTLFNATSYSGSFSIVSHTPGQVVTWNTSQLAVNGTVSVGTVVPAPITAVVNGSNLDLSWPAEALGAQLQSQTNSLAVGITATWSGVAGSTATNAVSIAIDPANPSVFLRLAYPPQ